MTKYHFFINKAYFDIAFQQKIQKDDVIEKKKGRLNPSLEL